MQTTMSREEQIRVVQGFIRDYVAKNRRKGQHKSTARVEAQLVLIRMHRDYHRNQGQQQTT